jgi:hypothetical protein
MGSVEYVINVLTTSPALIYSLTEMANYDALNSTLSF